jgi:hypothetical protein
LQHNKDKVSLGKIAEAVNNLGKETLFLMTLFGSDFDSRSKSQRDEKQELRRNNSEDFQKNDRYPYPDKQGYLPI